MAIMAIISRIWIIPPTLYAKKPMAHNMIRITAIKYSRLLMVLFLVFIDKF